MAGSPTPYAGNPHGVLTRPVLFDAPGAPTIKTYHGISIVVEGNIIGRINSWNPQMYSREGTWVYELNDRTWGRAVDYVPGRNTNYTISANRTEVWNQEIEIALGFPAVWADLMDQNRPFEITQYLFRGPVVYRSWIYRGCWFGDRNEAGFEAEGDAKIVVNSTINFVSRVRGAG